MICKIEMNRLTEEAVSIYIRLKEFGGTQRQYNRFRRKLYAMFRLIKSSGYGGRSGLVFDKCHVSLCKSEGYFHITIFATKDSLKQINEALSEFDAIKNK